MRFFIEEKAYFGGKKFYVVPSFGFALSTYYKVFSRRYEDQKAGDLNARLTKDYDKFDMVLQAFQYEKREREARPAFLQQFFDSTAGVIKTRAVRKWQTALLKTRQDFFRS